MPCVRIPAINDRKAAMANPEYTEKLDTHDKISVCLYRTGISLFAVAMFAYSLVASSMIGVFSLSPFVALATVMTLCVASALTAGNLHVYSKHVRSIIVGATWIGLLVMLFGGIDVSSWIALGFLFVTFSGVALKESFCFKVYGLKFVPVLLALNTLFIGQGYWQGVMVCSAVVGIIMTYLAIQKWRMPLHFDIGIKANYEV